MLGKRTGSAWMIAGAALMAAGILLHRAERHAHGHRREAPGQEHAPNPDNALLTAVYAATLGAGLLSLQSPQEPIGDSWFSILEIVIILTMSPMVAMMAAVHAWAHAEAKVFNLMALVFMSLLAGLTVSV